MRRLLGTVICALALSAHAESSSIGIVLRDHVELKPAPRESARPHAVLWQGEAVEVRGERLDYLQVWEHRRERGGFLRASQVRRFKVVAEEVPELLSIVRFLRDVPGAESLGIGFAAAAIQAAPAEVLNGEAGAELLDVLGGFADRLALRASSSTQQSRAAQAALSGHLDSAARHGVKFTTAERDGRVQVCYDGDAFRRVLALRSGPEARARAALGLTRPECAAPEGKPMEKKRLDEWRAEVLDKVEEARLPATLRNRILVRRASVWAALAYQRARLGEPHEVAASRALSELVSVQKNELTEEDLPAYTEAAMRVNASRWAAVPIPSVPVTSKPRIITADGNVGETCVSLVDAKDRELAKRCTYGLVWNASYSVNREGTAASLAVQTGEAWRELWVFRKTGGEWALRVLPPAGVNPGAGYAEFAGWVPGGSQMLVAREASGEGKTVRNFEVLSLDSFRPLRQAGDAAVLGPFQRWQDAGWKRMTVALR